MDNVFLACFAFGALFTAASALLGHLGHMGHVHHGHHAGNVSHASGSRWRAALSLLNLNALTVFLTWFGALGLALRHYLAWLLWPTLGVAIASGLAAVALVTRFLNKIQEGDRPLDPRDFELVGTVARVSVSIPAGGVGEIIFSKAARRRSEAARSLGSLAIGRDTEVVITEYAHGVATVQPWTEFMAESR